MATLALFVAKNCTCVTGLLPAVAVAVTGNVSAVEKGALLAGDVIVTVGGLLTTTVTGADVAVRPMLSVTLAVSE